MVQIDDKPHPSSANGVLGHTTARLVHTSSVLIVDDDPLRRAALACSVLRTGVVVVLGASTSECRSIAAILAPSVVVGLLGPNPNLLAEIENLLSISAHTAAIIAGATDTKALLRQIPRGRGRVHALAMPPPPTELAQLILRYCPARGIAGPFSPAEYVQQAGLGGHSVSLYCVNAAGQELGVIVMKNGNVHSARHASRRGFEAFSELVTRHDARVLLGEAGEGDADADLVDHWQSLVLESMRRYDEREREGGPKVSAVEDDASGWLGEAPHSGPREALTRAASIPALPVTEMRDALGSTRGNSVPEVRALVEQGVRAVIEQDYARAIQTLERALALDPRNASVRHRLDRLYAIAVQKS